MMKVFACAGFAIAVGACSVALEEAETDESTQAVVRADAGGVKVVASKCSQASTASACAGASLDPSSTLRQCKSGKDLGTCAASPTATVGANGEVNCECYVTAKCRGPKNPGPDGKANSTSPACNDSALGSSCTGRAGKGTCQKANPNAPASSGMDCVCAGKVANAVDSIVR